MDIFTTKNYRFFFIFSIVLFFSNLRVFTILININILVLAAAYFLQKTIKIYNKEIISLENLLTGMKIQFQKGNISFLEISRLESMLLSLKKEKNEQENSLFLF